MNFLTLLKRIQSNKCVWQSEDLDFKKFVVRIVINNGLARNARI